MQTQAHYYAHSRPDLPQEQWHRLDQHLVAVAEQAAEFAKPFGGETWAYLAGLWHDLGKYNPDFQKYLHGSSKEQAHEVVPHAVWGAALAYQLFWKYGKDAERWKYLSLPIHGHHSGLHDDGELALRIETFLGSNPEALEIMRKALGALPKPADFATPVGKSPHSRDMAIRMVFSVVVDADRLNTEEFLDRSKAARRAQWSDISTLWQTMQAAESKLDREVQDPDSNVNQVRRDVRRSCLTAATSEASIFRLTVPTGGGKTRSALAFALKRAGDMPQQDAAPRRVIVALPYTSIIDQTAGVYRKLLGDSAVLEHHSQAEANYGEEQTDTAFRARLACENWDAPVIVTTTVQLFESLFANQPGKTRKLHNLARSVLILDEVQALPPELLRPILSAVRTLAEEYGVTVVLSTATQPAFEETEFLSEFRGVRVQEIVPECAQHFARLERVTYEIRANPVPWEEIAADLCADTLCGPKQTMIVLNSRKDALLLLDMLDGVPDVFHLSTLLCGAHRKAILKEIRSRLDLRNPRPVRLVATQVVEAGVDLDFPTVWRAMAPLDRIVQAAGRCNREGTRPTAESKVVVFEPAEGRAPQGPYRLGIEKARQLLSGKEGSELHKPDLYREYFRQLYNDVDHSLGREIQQYREQLNFPKVAERFKLIREDTVSVAVNYRDGLKRLDAWKNHPCRQTWQELQPYLVSVYAREVPALQNEGWLEPVQDGLYRWNGKYDETRGIRTEYDPSDLIP